jgi:hypothetical protein
LQDFFGFVERRPDIEGPSIAANRSVLEIKQILTDISQEMEVMPTSA